jgi:hypothetical protein
MDTEIYSEASIKDHLRKTLFFGDKVLEHYFEKNDLSAFRKRLHRLHKDRSIDGAVQAYVTDVTRDIVLKIIGDLTSSLKSMGDLIISGGEAFNRHLPREDRVVTGDIDTKFVPRVKYDAKYFGKLQGLKLILWDHLGATAKNYNKVIRARIDKDKSKLKKFLGISFTTDGPWLTRRYTLIKKNKQSPGPDPSTGDIFIDVELFALDLNIGYFSPEKGRVVQTTIGGILDVPIMRGGEFGYEVVQSQNRGIVYRNKDSNAIIQDKRVAIAGIRFLFDDVYLLQKLGLRKDKVAKDKKRMIKLAKVLDPKMNFKSTQNIDEIFAKVYKKIKTPRRSIKPFLDVDMRAAARVNPLKYEEYTTPPVLRKVVAQFVIGLKTSVPINFQGFRKTYGRHRFNTELMKWVKNNSNAYIGNQYGYRPASANENIANKILDVPYNYKLLYGFRPKRDAWVNKKILVSSSLLPFVGLKT